MRVLNLTPHDVTLRNDSGSVTLPPVSRDPDGCPRVSVVSTGSGSLSVGGVTVAVVRNAYGAVDNLPPYDSGTFLIVSRMVAEAARRPDLFYPDGFVRENGVVVAATRLGQVL